MIRVFFILLIFSGSCFAQDSTRFDKLIPRTALKFTPFTLINFYSSLELSFEQKIAKRFTAQIGYGYVFNFRRRGDPEFENMRGAKVKLEIRYYLLPSERYTLSNYIALGVYRNGVDFDRETPQQECYDLSCTNTFTRYYNYKVQYREHGLTLKYGFVKHFRKSIFIDFNTGWSFRFIDYDKPTLSQAFNGFGFEESFIDLSPKEEDWFTLTPLVCLRIGYRFR